MTSGAPAKTYRASDPESIAATIHIPQYVRDAIEIAESIVAKYGARKLVLLGHSWGTVIAFQAALARPDLFHAYLGIGQIINTRTNEELSFTYGLEQARQTNNVEAVQEMESIAPYPGETPVTRERIIIARKWPQYYGGLTAYRDDSSYYFYAPLLSPEYTPEDIDAIGEGNEFTLAKILPEFLDVDFTGVREFPIPVLMFMGLRRLHHSVSPHRSLARRGRSAVQARRVVRELSPHDPVRGTRQDPHQPRDLRQTSDRSN